MSSRLIAAVSVRRGEQQTATQKAVNLLFELVASGSLRLLAKCREIINTAADGLIG